MTTKILNSLNDNYIVPNILGNEIRSSAEVMAWNNLWLILLSIAALMALVNKLDPRSKNNNLYDKLLYGGLSVISLAGLFYPMEFGLLGVNVWVTMILVVEFFRYNKITKRNKW